jgi:hypothetical protein
VDRLLINEHERASGISLGHTAICIAEHAKKSDECVPIALGDAPLTYCDGALKGAHPNG